MTSIASYVFVDLETTGIPREEDNRTKITEISLVAVKREHVLETRAGAAPRVQNKLTLCLNPGKLINPSCSEVTGLWNDLLEHETQFDHRVFSMIKNFLDVLQKPVCLIAQNGVAFDYPIIKRHLEKLNVSFTEDLMCADCLHAFYDIEEAKRQALKDSNTNISAAQSTVIEENEKPDIDLLLHQENTLDMKSINETTPKRPEKAKKFIHKTICKAKRRFPWSGAKPKESYKLKDIYERVLNRPALEAHRAENDCILALEVAVAFGNTFVDWVDKNCCPFKEVTPMTIGVPMWR